MAAVQGMEGYSCDGCRCSAGAPAGLPYAIVLDAASVLDALAVLLLT